MTYHAVAHNFQNITKPGLKHQGWSGVARVKAIKTASLSRLTGVGLDDAGNKRQFYCPLKM